MLTEEGCRNRRRRLWDNLPTNVELVVISDPEHVTYFTGYFQPPFVFRTTNAAANVILTPDDRAILVCDNMLKAYAGEAHADEVVAPAWYEGKETADHREAQLVASTLQRLGEVPGDHIGLEQAQTPTGIVEGLRESRKALKLTPVDAAIHRIKRQKDPDELEVIRKSIRAGEAGHSAALREVRPGMTEFDVYLLVQQACMREAGEQAIVYGDFVSGPRCEQRGGPPSHRVIESSDMVLLDFSVVIGGYRGDFTNSFVCGEKPPAELQRLFEACMDAMQAGEDAAKPGVACRDIDAAVRASFEEKHLAHNFTTHTGHGLGLGHPDPPYLVPDSGDTLLEGDVIAIEPGQYIPGLTGMRYEHNYLVTADGLERLSNHALTLNQSG